jgi:hypothetical protein
MESASCRLVQQQYCSSALLAAASRAELTARVVLLAVFGAARARLVVGLA